MKSMHANRLWLAFSCLLLILTFSCGSKERYAGLYKAKDVESSKHAETYLELKANGEGIWRTPDDEVPFKWYVKGDEIRLNTKLGGVIVAEIRDNTLKVKLPGKKVMSFKRAD